MQWYTRMIFCSTGDSSGRADKKQGQMKQKYKHEWSSTIVDGDQRRKRKEVQSLP